MLPICNLPTICYSPLVPTDPAHASDQRPHGKHPDWGIWGVRPPLPSLVSGVWFLNPTPETSAASAPGRGAGWLWAGLGQRGGHSSDDGATSQPQGLSRA